MATHDYVLANASGAAFRADLNNALAAIVSNNSSTTEPATTYAYMWWADTTSGRLKRRNAANDDWIVIQDLDGTLFVEDGTAAAPGLAFTEDVDTGIFRPTTNEFAFAVNGGEVSRFDASGQFLVGATSTSEDLRALFQGNGAGNPGRIYVTSSSDAPSTNGSLGKLVFSDNGHVPAGEIDIQRDGGTWTSGASQPTAITFSTTADSSATTTERMRINSEGEILLGCTSDPGSGTGGSGFLPLSNDRMTLEMRTSTTTARELCRFYNSNGQVGDISTSGSATIYATSSDYRLKENIIPLTGAIDRVNQLKVNRFNFIADPSTTVDGFLAHEAQAVVPECVTGVKDEVDERGTPVYQSIDQSKLVPLLTAALQEAIAKIEILETKVADLEGGVN